jgi:hypothetical protein
VQVRLFEPAFQSPLVHYAMMPYAPSVVSVVSPFLNAPVAAAAAGAELAAAGGLAAAVAARPMPGYNFNACGTCGTATSQLPPNGFEAWRGLVERNNQPYQDLFGAGYLQGGYVRF